MSFGQSCWSGISVSDDFLLGEVLTAGDEMSCLADAHALNAVASAFGKAATITAKDAGAAAGKRLRGDGVVSHRCGDSKGGDDAKNNRENTHGGSSKEI